MQRCILKSLKIRKRRKINKKKEQLSTIDAALLSVSIANEKKAKEAIILNVRTLSSISDYVIICSGTSDRQVKAIADSVIKNLKKFKIMPLSVEGYSEGKWVLLDFNDFIFHIFYEPLRSYYRLEELWPEAEEVSIPKDYLKGFDKIER